jgi:phosphoglucomutase
MITASHNPKEYNGYKVFWSDGAQVTSPVDKDIVAEVAKITDPSMVKFEAGEGAAPIEVMGHEMDEAYLDSVMTLMLSPEARQAHKDIKIVYTPIHGSGVEIVPEFLQKLGFENIYHVPEQDVVDGNFPTVMSPNPEEPSALAMAVAVADREGADLVMATDPDADRIGIAVRDNEGKIVLLNGNQTLVLIMCYQLTRWAELGLIKEGDYVVKTIVTSMMPDAVAAHYGVKCYNCLTGFKYIAKIIREQEGKHTYIGGGEESFGYLAGAYVRDKDGVSACSLAAEAAAWCRDTKGMTLYEWLQDLYVKFGFYREGLVNVVRKGKDGAEQIQNMMVEFRANPPKSILGSPVVQIYDYKTLELLDTVSGTKSPIPGIEDKSNVLQWVTADGTKVSVRPSGTEPKIKFYFGVKATLPSVDQFDEVQAALDAKFEAIKAELNL